MSDQAQQILANIKHRYKPILKSKSKNQLIDIICTLSMEVIALKAEIRKLSPEKAAELDPTSAPIKETSNE